jgi:medium-chain acyl-[acyl-carrier-protein] hydrolase
VVRFPKDGVLVQQVSRPLLSLQLIWYTTGDYGVKQAYSPWITDYRLPQQGQARVFMFPYSGAGSLAYFPWANAWREHGTAVDFLGVQLPGRESRLREVCITAMPVLVEQLLQAMMPLLDKPFVFFGHSLGALVAFDVCRELRQQGLPLPQHLFVSAFRAPDLPNPNPSMSQLSEVDLIAKLRHYGGTPEAVLENADLRELLLPIVRADFALRETYQYRNAAPLPCPLTALTGADDTFVTPEYMAGWHKQTSEVFEQVVYPGGHFFLHEQIVDISRRLQSVIQ